MLLNAIIFLTLLCGIATSQTSTYHPSPWSFVTPVDASQYPFIAEIAATNTQRGPNCAATIVRLEYPFTILTASRCLEWFDKQTPSYLFLGKTYPTQSGNNNYTIHQNQVKTVAHPNASINYAYQIALIFYDMDLSQDERLKVAELGTIDNVTNECCEDGDRVQQIGYYSSYEWNYEFERLGFMNLSFINRKVCIKKRSEVICPDCSELELPETMMCATINGKWQSVTPCITQDGAPVIATGTNTLLGFNGYRAGHCADVKPDGYAIPNVFVSAAAFGDWVEDEIDSTVDTLTSNPTNEPTTVPTLEPTIEPTLMPEPTENESKDNGPDLDSIGFIFLWIFCAMFGLACIAILAVTCDRFDRQRRLGHQSLPTVHDDDNL